MYISMHDYDDEPSHYFVFFVGVKTYGNITLLTPMSPP